MPSVSASQMVFFDNRIAITSLCNVNCVILSVSSLPRQGSEVNMIHEYDGKTCRKCGEEFCWACCRDTNVHHGGKYDKDFMLCPKCGHDWYEEDETENLG